MIAWKSSFAALLIALAPGSSPASGETGVAPSATSGQPRIAAIEIVGLHQFTKDGVYDQLLERGGVGRAMLLMSPKRAEAAWLNKEVECLVPADPRFYPKVDTVASKTLNHAYIYAFSAKGAPPITRIQSLSGLHVGTRFGLPYGPRIDALDLRTTPSYTDQRSFELLRAKRVDAVLAYTPDVLALFKQFPELEPSWDRERPLEVHRDSVVCHRSEATEALMARLNERLQPLLDDGTAKTLLGPLWGRPDIVPASEAR